MPTYSLAELAKLADITPRTIRFYIVQGLLPSPDQQGPNTRYSDEHLARLLAIKKLQAAHLPLAEIRQHLRGVPEEHLTALAAPNASAPSPGSAADYIREVLNPSPKVPRHVAYEAPQPAASQPAPSQSEPPTSRSQWERIPLDPDIELHIRRPLTRQSNKRVERLIAIARELFEED